MGNLALVSSKQEGVELSGEVRGRLTFLKAVLHLRTRLGAWLPRRGSGKADWAQHRDCLAPGGCGPPMGGGGSQVLRLKLGHWG